ncbi:MAG: tRNA lysidine(34) synthetase TilS [Coprobacillus sp.]
MNECLLDKSQYYVIGVSGGCDSMYLLDTLFHSGYHLFVAHVNYNYRHDSYMDYELVCDYCAEHGIPFFYKSFHEKDYDSGNFQDRARSLRYDFYKEIYSLYKCDGVILGHHLDDHLETIYMQLSKHNTVHYLGIKNESHVKGMRVVRPLMNMYKSDIVDCCGKQHIAYHDDYTNFETDFERDKVRNTILNHYTLQEKEELIQKAFEHNQRIKELEFKVKPYYQQYKVDGQIYYYYIPDYLRDIFLYLILKDIMHPQLISLSLIEEIKHQVNSIKPNIQMNLPVNYLFIKEYDNVYIVDKDKTKGYCYEFKEFIPFGCEYFHLLESGHMNEGVYLSQEDYPITIRTIQDGDSIMTSSGTKKLSRLFINAKIPALKRKTWPVVLNKDKTIVLVPNIAKNIDYLTTKPNVFVIK